MFYVLCITLYIIYMLKLKAFAYFSINYCAVKEWHVHCPLRGPGVGVRSLVP